MLLSHYKDAAEVCAFFPIAQNRRAHHCDVQLEALCSAPEELAQKAQVRLPASTPHSIQTALCLRSHMPAHISHAAVC
jgi:hypothetical protein